MLRVELAVAVQNELPLRDLVGQFVRDPCPANPVADLKEEALTRKVHLACKLPPDFVKWLQEYYAQMKGAKREESYGENTPTTRTSSR